MSENIKKILDELKKKLVEIYGDQLQAVYLYGSYARGDAHPPAGAAHAAGPFPRGDAGRARR